MRRLAVLLVLLALCAPLIAGERWNPRQLNARERDAFDYLLGVTMFEDVTVGLVSMPSDSYVAVRTLAQSPHAERAFRLLLDEATPVGRVYALIALRRADRAGFEELARTVAAPKLVAQQSGCIVSQTTLSRLVDEVRRGQHDVFLDGRPGEDAIPMANLRAAIEERKRP